MIIVGCESGVIGCSNGVMANPRRRGGRWPPREGGEAGVKRNF